MVLFVCCRNRAIADYLRSNGYEEAYSTFKKEAELDNVSILRVAQPIRPICTNSMPWFLGAPAPNYVGYLSSGGGYAAANSSSAFIHLLKIAFLKALSYMYVYVFILLPLLFWSNGILLGFKYIGNILGYFIRYTCECYEIYTTFV